MMWPMVPFSKVAEIVTGNTPPRKNPENYGPGVPWVKPPDLDGWEPITCTNETLSPMGQKIARLLPEKTVLVCCIGSIGRVGIAGTTLSTNQQINSLIFGPSVSPRFGYHYCRFIPQVFQAAARKAVLPILNKSNFAKIKMPLPPPSEQRRIVEILDHADALRKKRTEADTKAARILPTLFYKMFGDPATNQKQWPIRKLGTLVEEPVFGLSKPLSNKTEHEPGTTPILRMANINPDGYLNMESLRYEKVPKKSLDRYLVKRGDLLFNWRNSPKWVGKTAIFNVDGDYSYASFLFRLRVLPEAANNKYIWQFLNLLVSDGWFMQKCRQAVSQANFGRNELADIDVPFPPLDAQKKFGNAYDKVCGHLQDVSCAKRKLEELFKNMLYRSFTGDLTAKWREAHMKELLAEMKIQEKYLEAKL